MENSDLVRYYSARAAEYDRVYLRPERQQELGRLRASLRRLLAGHDVLEVACGTGYWTAVIAPVAQSVVATDASAEVLELARARSYPPGKVRFALADAYELGGVAGEFTAGLAAFWWSHVPRQKLSTLLSAFHRRLGPGARVLFVDNCYREGSSTPLAGWDEDGNSYQERVLEDGSHFRIVKNFPTPGELRTVLSGRAKGLRITFLHYYWSASYRVSSDA